MHVPRHPEGLEATPYAPRHTDPNYHKPAPSPRGRGNPDYRSKAFVSAPQVDDSVLKLTDDDVYDFRVDFIDSPELPDGESPVHSFSLYELAKPAKKRGTVKEFEVIPRVRNAVVLSEEEHDGVGLFYVASTCGDDEDWERISETGTTDQKHQLYESQSDINVEASII
ncbi:hypothetical protein BJ165DRAFT_1525792 [Panaeolus papilionaceus]|nr:hypothetical protein BJ165DRAFT_1525792 [Panaeolus papilionaceus]